MKNQFKAQLMHQINHKLEMMRKRKRRKKKKKKKRKKKRKKRRKKKKKKKRNLMHLPMKKLTREIPTWMLIWIQMNSILEWTIIKKKKRKLFQRLYLLKRWQKWNRLAKIYWKILPQEWKSTVKINSGGKTHSLKNIMVSENDQPNI